MLNSREYYKIVKGWDIENYLENGIRYCSIFIKNSQSFNDELVVRYTNTITRLVMGHFLYTDLDVALAFIEKEKDDKLSEIDYKIYELNNDKDNIINAYNNIYIEPVSKEDK